MHACLLITLYACMLTVAWHACLHSRLGSCNTGPSQVPVAFDDVTVCVGRPSATLRSQPDSIDATQAGRSAATTPSAAAASTREAPSGQAADVAAPSASSGGSGCPRGHHWSVQKFGGTCVSSAERISAAAELIISAAQDGQQQVNLCSELTAFCEIVAAEYLLSGLH